MQTALEPGDIDHYYGVFVYVNKTAECPHGEGQTVPVDGYGVRIKCPEGKDCWVVKWEWDKDASH